ncbi:MAG: hypothetical protein FJX23_05715 [Alphaproteobacteria bacterium]|nr:hypothetical protein [Alphaproteobacteria bacterium]
MKKLPALILLLLIVGYAALLFTSSGVLVSSRVEVPDNAVNNLLAEIGAEQSTLTCTYFTGFELVERKHLYSENDTIGRAICPRTIQFGEKN